MTNTALLDMLNTAASSEVDEQAVRLLRDSNFESDLAQQIVRQVRAATARGSVLSISGPQTNTNAAQDVGVIADVGFVFASGPSSGWLFAVEPDTTDALSIYPTTAGAVGKICTAFIAEF